MPEALAIVPVPSGEEPPERPKTHKEHDFKYIASPEEAKVFRGDAVRFFGDEARAYDGIARDAGETNIPLHGRGAAHGQCGVAKASTMLHYLRWSSESFVGRPFMAHTRSCRWYASGRVHAQHTTFHG